MKLFQFQTREKIRQKNEAIYHRFQERQKWFKKNWDLLKYSERVEVHYNSLSFQEFTRLSQEKFFQQ